MLFSSRGEPGKNVKAERAPTVSRRQFLVSAAAVTASLGCNIQRTQTKPMNVVVFLADTMRADHLSCSGYPTRTSPALEALARESIIFDRCYSQCSWTKPSIASLFSGTLPQIHQAGHSDWDFDPVTQVNDVPVQVLRPCFTTLAERFEQLGYHTGYFLANAHGQDRFGFARGFSHYEYHNGWPAPELVQAVMDWLRKEAKEPFFLFVHELDPHKPYTPTEANYLRLFGRTQDAAFASLTDKDRSEIDRMSNVAAVKDDEEGIPVNGGFRRKGLVPPVYTSEGIEYIKSCYDGEILGVDDQFGRLMQCLRETKVDDNTAVVFTSDHGECIGEHGWYGHGCGLFKPELNVPLIMRLPASMRRQERVPWSVSMFDLHPTLVALAGGKIAEELQAKPLLHPNGATAVNAHRESFSAYGQRSQTLEQWDQALIHGPWKVHLTNAAKNIAAYNFKEDPGELNNLLASGAGSSPVLQELVERFHKAREQYFKVSASYGEPMWISGGDSYKDELSALGYL